MLSSLRSVLRSNAADRPNEEITISSKHALIKRMAWAMLRLLQERGLSIRECNINSCELKALQRTPAPLIVKGMLNSNACTTTEC